MGKVEWLSWRGYSAKRRISLFGWTEGFAFPSRFYERVPYCIESYEHFRNVDGEERLAFQQQLLEQNDHSVMSALYPGVIKAQEIESLKHQLTIALKTIVKLLQLTTVDNIDGAELNSISKSLPPDMARYLKSALTTSLYYYANGKKRKVFEKILQQPLYLECGIDVLTSGLDKMLAEFQVRYSTPYPHLLDYMSASYGRVAPWLFEKFGLEHETFSIRRREMLNKCMDQFAALADDEPVKMVIDAWAYLNNSGANLRPTAEEFKAEYLVFDDMNSNQNPYEKAYRGKRLSIFNQPPLNLLDPNNEIFDTVNSEKLEWYDELGWEGMLDSYLNGQIFIANAPSSDIINDKALYSVVPAMAKVLYGEELSLPVVDATPCWDMDDYRKPDEAILADLKANKDKSVIAHRYLEGGMGIRVGPAISQEEWESFIDTFVVDRPYLYVVRSYFSMDPDMSLRLLACGSLPNYLCDSADTKLEFSDTAYGRLTTQPPLATDNHRSFLVFPVSPSAPEPRYEMELVEDIGTR